MTKRKKAILWAGIGTGSGILAIIILTILTVFIVFSSVYATRLKTISSIEQITTYDDGFDLYTMEVKYDYSIEDIIAYGIDDNQDMFDAILKEALPLLPIKMEAPSFGCTAFNMTTKDGEQLMGRNYDFKNDTSSLLIYCSPKDGYKSMAFAALDNVKANSPLSSISKKLATLTAPFICLDGINEKGVSIAVLVVDSEPVNQDTGKDKIFTTLAIRLVLDKAASTEEAINLLRQYDMFASSGKDYHFYINDSTGNGVVVEWDCESPTREIVTTKVDVVTNFYTMYEEKVLPNQRNGIYGHGKERYEIVKSVLKAQNDNLTVNTAWDALKESSQKPSETEITSNTQWSIVYDNTSKTAQIVLRRHWGDVYNFNISK